MKRSLLGVTALTTLALAVISGAGGAKPASAATVITVNTTSDEAVTDGQCSLREAVSNADANNDATGGDCAAGSPGADTIDLSSLSGTITLTSTLPTISDELLISGPGAGVLTIDANGHEQVFTVGSALATIDGLTMIGAAINDGNLSSGTAILSNGALTVENSTITGNSGRFGGGIASYGSSLTVENSAISGNSAGNSGGGILNESPTATISNTTISGNQNGIDFGGGIVNFGGALTIEKSTISGNSGGIGSSGGAIWNGFGTTLTVTNSTISGNSAFVGGGIDNYFGTATVISSTITANSSVGGSGITGGVTIKNTIVAAQTAGADCAQPAPDGGYNLDDDGTCGLSSANHSLSNTDPLLDPAGLRGNGGPTQTIALQPGSPAINAIPAGINGCGTTITIDQRGVSRPQGSGCDIGAFEREVVPVDLAITKAGSPNPVISGDRLTYTMTVTDGGSGDATGVTVTDPLPDAVHFNSMSSTQGSCTRSTTRKSPKNGTVTCSLGALASGATASITIVVTATTPGTLTNKASVLGKEPDPNPANNSATATTTVIGT
jgi:uncharacterized repeat protein (TIGR01451 family)/CSLREA domain-containing protein